MTVVSLHGVNAVRLAEVVAEMRRLGPPTVRCVEVAGVLYAVEGTHRLAAAQALGVEPEMMVLDRAGAVPDDLDIEDIPAGSPLQDLIDYVASGDHGPVYSFGTGVTP